ncbi:protein kinase 1, putative [Plasmodium malariae]|uniref:Protein kinase 1, putative n=1 Tax=Plasmodium malariae TaxID=5858 RepID=A0A1C3KLP9_PLAMA|nr:protein kinase 1, putative [Plasmodium malariae]
MDLIKIYKKNEIIKDYVNIYFDDEKLKYDSRNISYKIRHIIGNGVYGVVYKADCLDSSSVVALKQTYQKNTKIFKEIEIMKKLKHPNIVKLKHAFYTTSSNGGVYVHMVMEYGNTDLATSLYYITIKNSIKQDCRSNHNNNGSSSRNNNNDSNRNNSNSSNNCNDRSNVYYMQAGDIDDTVISSNNLENIVRCDYSRNVCFHGDGKISNSRNSTNDNIRNRKSTVKNFLKDDFQNENQMDKPEQISENWEDGKNCAIKQSYHAQQLNKSHDFNSSDTLKYLNSSGKNYVPNCINSVEEISNIGGNTKNVQRSEGDNNDYNGCNSSCNNDGSSSSSSNCGYNYSNNDVLKHNNMINNFNINALQESINDICPCHNLSEYIKNSFLNENQIKIYLYQLIRATLYLHSLCITHRDIKPQNILIFLNKTNKANNANSSSYSSSNNNGKSNNDLTTKMEKGSDNKKCLVCIQNSFKFKCIMNRRNKNINTKGDKINNVEKKISSINVECANDKLIVNGSDNLTTHKKEGEYIKKKSDDSFFFVNNNRSVISGGSNINNDINNNNGREGIENTFLGKSKSISFIDERENKIDCSSNSKLEKYYSYYNSNTTASALKKKRNSFNKTYVKLKRSMSMTNLHKGKCNSWKTNYSDYNLHVSKKNLKKILKKNKTDILLSTSHTHKSCTILEEEKMIHVSNEKLSNNYVDDKHCIEEEEKKKIIIREEVNVNDIDNLSYQNNLDELYMNSIMYKYIKLCDFNTSIKLKENYKYFSYVCSRYYRAPELLFGSNYYSQAIDTWSIGCVMGELMLGKPLFLGDCASDQLVEIIKILGTPNDEDFLSFRSVYKNVKFPDIKPITLKKLISHNCSQESIDLLDKLLQFNPQKRIKLCNALLHNYFDDIRNLKVFNKDINSDNNFSLPFNTNCFNFTKEELLHFTVEERKILIPLDVRRRKLDEVMQYIDMTLENFDKLYPNKIHLAC